jgi:hypothetical protein
MLLRTSFCLMPMSLAISLIAADFADWLVLLMARLVAKGNTCFCKPCSIALARALLLSSNSYIVFANLPAWFSLFVHNGSPLIDPIVLQSVFNASGKIAQACLYVFIFQ